jgi:hypothetical protein
MPLQKLPVVVYVCYTILVCENRPVFFRVTDLTSELESQRAEMEELRNKLNWEETQRRKLHNMVQELKVGHQLTAANSTKCYAPP